ncbi:hypothetical protein ACCO45_004251 [Purpureocillium lilacinum]|uniref:Uncharacterized protein n=1 Tax=Purpureocillium lilacinum TaxID=33203 RepID=A0ACC4E322_PURLI
MAPETRSRGVPPPNRVYNSSPALQQVQFPSRRKKIRTYGRQASAHTSSLRQQTLTQIDFVSSFDDDGEDVITLTDSEDEAQQAPRSMLATVATRRIQIRKPKGLKESKASRRRTMGDAPSSSSKYHTQTLTQFLGQRSFIADSDDEGDDLGLVPSEEEGDKGRDDGFMEWLGEPGSPSVRRSKTRRRMSASPSPQRLRGGRPSQAQVCPSREESVIPQTPAKLTTAKMPCPRNLLPAKF